MKTLYLPLKREYFEAIKSGKKLEEYRLYNAYWRRRIEGKEFDRLVLTLGYPSRDDSSRHIVRPWLGYKIKMIDNYLGSNVSVKVFVIEVIRREYNVHDL